MLAVYTVPIWIQRSLPTEESLTPLLFNVVVEVMVLGCTLSQGLWSARTPVLTCTPSSSPSFHMKLLGLLQCWGGSGYRYLSGL